MKYTFVKQNDEPIDIEYFEDTEDESLTIRPGFVWNGCRYYLDQFIRCHNNPWILDTFPEHIHAMQLVDVDYEPLFIELVGSENVNIYIG